MYIIFSNLDEGEDYIDNNSHDSLFSPADLCEFASDKQEVV